ncbi:MAG: FAD-dependent oxidoreductase [Anaerolineae bacterium]|nr:FAD-dependent oxidoreductase [Anaerolineae bacterium]
MFIGSGFQKDAALDIEGIQSKGVYAALDLLEKVRRGIPVDLGHKALVIGGGDTAMDAAGVSKRLTGQPATIVYRRTLAEMPASPEEREATFEEGTQLLELASPMRVISENGHVVGLECIKNKLGEPGPDGRRRPVPVQGSEFVIPTDSIILAIGQEPDLYFMQTSQVLRTKNGAISGGAIGGESGIKGVYAGGDAVINPDSIISACADGENAAEAICKQLGVEFDTLPFKPAGINEDQIRINKNARVIKQTLQKPAFQPLSARAGFDLLERTYSEAQAKREAERCLQCASYCDKCVEVCPNRANLTYFVPAIQINLPVIVYKNNKAEIVRNEILKVTQTRQIVHIDDLCNECGNCDTFCVHAGKPYREKPRLFFDENVYNKESDNAYFVEKIGSTWSIRSRVATEERELKLEQGLITFETPRVKSSFSLPDFDLTHLVVTGPFDGEESLVEAGEMFVLVQGLIKSMPYLPYRGN